MTGLMSGSIPQSVINSMGLGVSRSIPPKSLPTRFIISGFLFQRLKTCRDAAFRIVAWAKKR
jgi:hypothetical protein